MAIDAAQKPAPDQRTKSLDFKNVVVTLRKYKLRILLITALVTLLTLMLVSLITPVYRASATLLISPPNEKNLVSIEELVAFDIVSKEYFQTQVEVLRSRKLAKRVVDSLDLVGHWEYNDAIPMPAEFRQDSKFAYWFEQLKQKVPFLDRRSGNKSISGDRLSDAVVDKLMRNVMIRPLKETNLVRVVVNGVDANMAKKIANGYGESFINIYLDTKLALTDRASTWLTQRLSGIKKKLDESEAQLLAYKERNGLIDLGGKVSGLNERQIGILTERLLEAKRERREAKVLLDEVNAVLPDSTNIPGTEVTLGISGDQRATSESLLQQYQSLAVVNTNPLVQRQRLAMLEAERKLDELSNRYGDKHPKVIDAKSNFTISTNNLNRQINNVVDSVGKRYRLAQATVRSLELELNEKKKDVHSVGRQQIQMVDLEREVEANRVLYVKFYNRVREAAEAEGMGTANATINDPASVTSHPIYPRKRLLVLLGFVVSLLGSSLFTLLFEKNRDTVQGVKDVAQRLGVPVLGIVPMLANRGLRRRTFKPLLPGKYQDPSSAFTESIKTVRSSLYLASDDSKVVLVTSSLPSEGKSTLAINLAYSMSLMEKVLLVEADMRRPCLDATIGISDVGLSNYLSYECELKDCLREAVLGDLDIIPAGYEPDLSLELLSSTNFGSMLAELSKRYDRIIVDSAPIEAVSDALIIGKQVDETVLVVKADSTKIEQLESSYDRLIDAGVDVSGVVISQVDMEKVLSYGGQFRYKGYYDHYGYGRPAKQWQFHQ